jgi:hypothetical protein
VDTEQRSRDWVLARAMVETFPTVGTGLGTDTLKRGHQTKTRRNLRSGGRAKGNVAYFSSGMRIP